jgi:3-oxoacyl-[acyl-carrier protein] reductase
VELPEGGERTAAEIGGRFLHVDVGDGESVGAMLGAAAAVHGRLDILVNNAGVPMRRQAVLEVPDAEWDRQLRLNLTSVWHGCRRAVAHLSSGGAIVNVASLAAVTARPGFSAYAVAKAGVVVLTRSLAQELAPAVRVNAVSPVSTDTPMLPDLLPEGQSLDDFKVGMRAGIPLGRLNRPDDVASAILYLASDEAAMVTGHNLVVSGGAA